MSRTTHHTIRGKARRGVIPWPDDLSFFGRFRGGNMLMAPRNGVWDDDRPNGSADRRAQRRTAKRRERAAWRREVGDELHLDSAADGL